MAWRSSSACRCGPTRHPTTAATSIPSAPSWDICWRNNMRTYEGMLVGSGLRVGIVVSRWNDTITRRLLEGALDGLRRHGVAEETIEVAWAPGSFELPLVCRR